MSDRTEYRFTRFVRQGKRAEGILVNANSIYDAAKKAIALVYEDEKPVTVLVLDSDFDGGYDQCVQTARAALEQQ